jgi:hypothetical protein
MADKDKRPDQYGLKIQDSVAGMLVTARNKMRAATRRRIGFSGEGPSTVAMYCDQRTANHNRSAVLNLIDRIGQSSIPEPRPTGMVWNNVPGRDLADHFFERYKSPAAAWKVQGDAIAEYIRDRLTVGELTGWTVLLASSADAGAGEARIAGRKVRMFQRKVLPALKSRVNEGFYSIKQLLSPGHETVDLEGDEYARALEITRREWERTEQQRNRGRAEPKTPVGWAIRQVRPTDRGLLVIYPLEPPAPQPKLPVTVPLTTAPEPVIGFLASFPVSPGAPAVLYQVNRVYNELFGEDDWDEEPEENS